MISKIKKIIIFTIVAGVLIFGVIFLTKKKTSDANLISSSSTPSDGIIPIGSSPQNSTVSGDFLNTLLSVKNIKLDDSIFSNPAFLSLHDSTIILVPDHTEGRPNPFAPIGFEKLVMPTTPAVNSTTNTPVVPNTNTNKNTGSNTKIIN